MVTLKKINMADVLDIADVNISTSVNFFTLLADSLSDMHSSSGIYTLMSCVT